MHAERCWPPLPPVQRRVLVDAPQAIADTSRFDELANAPFVENRPTPETARTLRDELLFQRATQAYLWALPLVNTLGMKVGSESVFGAGYNVLPIWKKRLDAKTLVTTPNSDVIYAMSYLDLGKDGPLVFEAPPNLQGILLDFWQRPIPVDGGKFYGDVGLPGPDGGKGGKFLLLPPGYQGDVPAGYYVYRSGTNNVFVFLRSFYKDPKDLAPAVALIEQSKIYPLHGKATAKPMQFPDASGVPANMLPRYDATAFDQLKQLLDSEGPHLADADSLGLLASIGIAQGQAVRTRCGHAGDSRAGREDGLQDEPRRRLRGDRERRLAAGLRRSAVGQSHRQRDAARSAHRARPVLEEYRWQLSRPRCTHLVLHQLLLGQPGDVVEDPRQGRGLHDRLHGRCRCCPLGRQQLSPESAG